MLTRVLLMTVMCVMLSTLPVWSSESYLLSQEYLQAMDQRDREAIEFVISVYTGEFLRQGGWIANKAVMEILNLTPNIAPYLLQAGVEFDPLWITMYVNPGYVSQETVSAIRDYAIEMWINGHRRDCEILRAALGLIEMYFPSGPAWQLQGVEGKWTRTKLWIMGKAFNLVTGQTEDTSPTVTQEMLAPRIFEYATAMPNPAECQKWLKDYEEEITQLIGDLAFLGLQLHTQNNFVFMGGDPSTVRQQWLIFLAIELSEFADSPEMYQDWIFGSRQLITDQIGAQGFERLAKFADALVRAGYPCLRSNERSKHNPILELFNKAASL